MPALISLVGASSRGGFSTNAVTRPSLVGRHHAEGRRVGHRMERDGALRPALSVEGDEGAEVEVGEDVAVDDDEGVVDPSVRGGETHGAGRVEGFGLDRVGQADPGGMAIGIRLLERVGEVAQRQDRLVDAVRRQVGQHPLDHRHPDDRAASAWVSTR